MKFLPVEDQLAIIKRGTSEIIPEAELRQKLERSRQTGKPLRIKLGVDPTASDLHLGFTVVIRKLRQFQDLGHQIILIIGNYTAMVGDPSGKNKTRPRLQLAEVEAHAAQYQEQFFKIVDREKTQVVRNGDWFANMNFAEVTELAAQMTVAQMLMREDFAKRYAEQSPISIHEFLYPLMQGWDSVQIEADVELGGSDQKFNVLVGRDLQKNQGREPQVGLFMPILTGTDGQLKMSKSYGNHIGINAAPEEMYGKTLSLPDEQIYNYFELVTDVSAIELAATKKRLESGENPRDLKRELARTLVRMYHSEAAASAAEEHFDRVFVKGAAPEDMPERHVKAGQHSLTNILCANQLVESKAAAKRLIQQGGVTYDGERIDDFRAGIEITDVHVLKAGKRKFLRLIAQAEA
jgi:tyrosyl-tRNA synthetase